MIKEFERRSLFWDIQVGPKYNHKSIATERGGNYAPTQAESRVPSQGKPGATRSWMKHGMVSPRVFTTRE